MAGSQSFSAPAQVPGLALKAWALVQFSGTNGAQTILKGSGLTSIVRSASGTYTVTFAQNMPDTNYGMTYTVVHGTGNTGTTTSTRITTPAVGSCGLYLYTGASPADPADVAILLLAFYD